MKLQVGSGISVSEKHYFRILELAEPFVLRLLQRNVSTNILNIVVTPGLYIYIELSSPILECHGNWYLSLFKLFMFENICVYEFFLTRGLYVRVAVPVLVQVVL